MNRILLVEDNQKLAASLAKGLAESEYEVNVAYTGGGAARYLAQTPPDIVILDLGLPDCDGLDMLRQMRRDGHHMPVLILTARGEVDDRVRGLDEGADDYLVKPFAFEELLARLRALARRGEKAEGHALRVDDLEIDLLTRNVRRADRRIELTPREYDLLVYLMRHDGQIVSREMLARDVWEETSRATPLDNVIDVHMAHLRKKLRTDSGPELVHVVRGVGIMLKGTS